MKKLFLSFAFLGIFTGVFAQHCADPSGSGVCSISGIPVGAAPGLYPDDADLPCLVKGAAVDATVSVQMPSAVAGLTVSTVVVNEILNLPPGLCWKSDSPNETWSGGSQGCINISGTPTAAGQYKLKIYGTADVLGFGVVSGDIDSLLSSFNITGFNYYLRVLNCAVDNCPAIDPNLPIVSQNGYSTGACAVQDAYVQVIHNAADPAAAQVDVYLNGVLALNDFAFRTATSFLALPAGVQHAIVIAPSTSTSVADGIWNTNIGPLTAGSNYVAIAQGVLNPASFDTTANPGQIGFTIKIVQNALQAAAIPNTTSVMWFPGVTDAGNTVVNTSALGTPIFMARPYAPADSGYMTIPSTWFAHIPSAGGAITPTGWVGDYTNDVNEACILLASGFRNPANNQNGPSYKLLKVFPSGIVEECPVRTIAKLQVIHNAADPAAASVDIYLNGRKAIPNFAFRGATSFLPVTAGYPYNVAIAPAGSTNVSQAIYTENIGSLASDSVYASMAVGVATPANFASNPDGSATGIDILVIPGVREVASVATNTDIKVVHGSTDVPTIDLTYPGGTPTVIDNLTYGEASNLLSVPSANIPGELRSQDGTIPYACVQLQLAQAQGAGAVIFASGFFTPASNQNGPALGIYMAKSNGQVVQLPLALGPCTSIGEMTNAQNLSLYPNPTTGKLNVDFDSQNTAEISVQVMDMTGKLLTETNYNTTPGFNSFKVDVTSLSNGLYILKLAEGQNTMTTRFSVNR